MSEMITDKEHLRWLSIACFMVGGLFIGLPLSILLETERLNPGTTQLLFTPSEQACKSDACLKYWDSITFNLRGIIFGVMGVGIVGLGVGIYFLVKSRK